jgi:starch synthase (maltosyl-transferring)
MPFASWRDGLEKKVAAGQEVGLELREGKLILAEALPRADGGDRAILEGAIAAIEGGADQGARVAAVLADEVVAAMRRHRSRAGTAESPTLEVVVDRVRARYAAWYSMFARSAGTVPGRSATFAEAAERLPAIAAMGFDTVYLLPIHPIGTTFRKGPNNTLGGGPDDAGVPYAIGSPDGGHTAIEPGLGTLEDFRAFVRRTEELGMEVALDVAIQASPDHPWVTEHPDWFTVVRMARSSTPRTRRRSTRTSTRSTSRRPPGASCGRSCWRRSCSGWTRGSRRSASTTPTPSRPSSGSG